MPRSPDERSAEEEARRERATQSFWTMVVGVPAIISVMRLVVESGGELQTTLLLVANVNPINLVAAFVTTATRVLSASLIVLFAISAVLSVNVERHPERWSGRRRPLLARWKKVAPVWLVIGTLVVALATWPILYLPFLVPAVAAMFQLNPARVHERRVPRVLIIVGLLAGYALFLMPTLVDAVHKREWIAFLTLAAPPVLALFITGPIRPATVRPLAIFGQLGMVLMMGWSVYSVVTTPVLPMTVTTIQVGPDETEDIRGSVIDVDDVHAVLLQERGGVRYIPTEQIRARVLCPSEEELPRYRLWVRGYHVEDSLLQGLGRRVRPVIPIDAACRIAPTVQPYR